MVPFIDMCLFCGRVARRTRWAIAVHKEWKIWPGIKHNTFSHPGASASEYILMRTKFTTILCVWSYLHINMMNMKFMVHPECYASKHEQHKWHEGHANLIR
jgi:hypothetical protein